MIANGDEPKQATGEASIPDWEKREGKEKTVLKMSVKDYIIPHIRECKSVSDIWMVLKDMYEIRNMNRLMVLKRNIMSIKM